MPQSYHEPFRQGGAARSRASTRSSPTRSWSRTTSSISRRAPSKLKLGGGIAGHNGLKDIAAQLGTHDYWRLRIGIGHPGDKNLVADYVLHSPSPDDRALIDEAIERSLEVAPLILAGDLQAAMMRLHTKKKPPPEEPGGAKKPPADAPAGSSAP